jgi:hypothetical protein
MHRWNIFDPDGEVLATIDAIEVELRGPNSILIHGVVIIWFPKFGIKLEREF